MLSCKQEWSLSNHLKSQCLKETCMLHVWKKTCIYLEMEARRSAATPHRRVTPTWGWLTHWWVTDSVCSPNYKVRLHHSPTLLEWPNRTNYKSSSCWPPIVLICSVLQGLYIDQAMSTYSWQHSHSRLSIQKSPESRYARSAPAGRKGGCSAQNFGPILP